MRCSKCGKHFDEELYSYICPGCGTFHSGRKEYDVSQYISARFDTAGKPQADKVHEKLHREYDRQSMQQAHTRQYNTAERKQAEKAHERLHRTYDSRSMKQAHTEKQQAYGLGNRTGTAEKKRSSVVLIMSVITVAAFIITVAVCLIVQQRAYAAYGTLDYEEAQYSAGEAFSLKGSTITVLSAEEINTDMLDVMPAGEKLVAVTVRIEETDGRDYDWDSQKTYISCGDVCKKVLSSYETTDLIPALYPSGIDAKDIFDENDLVIYSAKEGKSGIFLAFVKEEEQELDLCLEEWGKRSNVYVLKKRIKVPLQIQEVQQ